MAFVRLAYFPDALQGHFDALAAKMSEAPTPRGRLLFAAGPVRGGWQVVQVWSSEAELIEYNREYFLPVLASLGSQAFPSPPVVTDFEPAVLSVPPDWACPDNTSFPE